MSRFTVNHKRRVQPMIKAALGSIRRVVILMLAASLWGGGMVEPPQGLAQTQKTSKAGLSGSALLSTADGTWTITADRLTYDHEREVYEAEGNVFISSQDRSIRAAWARLDAENRQAELRGQVHLQYGRDWLKGERVLWNLDEATGWVDTGLVFFAENHFYVQGREISKTGDRRYELKEGFITSCDPQSADWKVRYKELKINLDGFASARGTSFLIGNVPVLYAPWIALPVDQRRQSGFLIPWGGVSDLNGIEGELPFYWAIREDMDATIYGRYMAKRGWMTGLEYRIAHEVWGEGIWLFHYLDDNASKSHLRSQGYPFQEENRFWLRSRHSFELPYRIEGRLDLDVVSDRNYLKEFEKGSTSYDYSDSMFKDFFGRGILNDETILARESSLYLEQPHESSLLSLDVRYWDQLDRSEDENTLQRLPALAFNVIPSRLYRDLPLYYTVDSSLVNYWRPEGNRGERLDVYPRLGYPLHWKNYLDIEPSIGLRSTAYQVNWDGEDSRNEWQNRLLSDLRLEMSSRLNRVYPWRIGDTVALQHAVRPEIVYEYVGESGEEDLPRFDRFDEDQARHDVRYGFSTFLTSKEIQRDAEGASVNTYRELARLQVFQAYHFQKPPEDVRFESAPEEGFSSFGLRLDLMPKRYLMLSYDAELLPEGDSAVYHDLFLTFDSGRGHIVRLDYQYQKDLPVDELITETSLKVLPNIYLNTYHDYSLERKEMFKQGYGIKYLHNCWGIGVAYEREDEDQRIAFSIDLLGLGGFKGSYGYGSEQSSSGLP